VAVGYCQVAPYGRNDECPSAASDPAATRTRAPQTTLATQTWIRAGGVYRRTFGAGAGRPAVGGLELSVALAPERVRLDLEFGPVHRAQICLLRSAGPRTTRRSDSHIRLKLETSHGEGISHDGSDSANRRVCTCRVPGLGSPARSSTAGPGRRGTRTPAWRCAGRKGRPC
jgi:hypothetical protein